MIQILRTLILMLVVNPLCWGEASTELPELHHRVAMPIPEEMILESKVELGKDGELICKSCHGLKDIASTPLEDIDSKSKDFLLNGPYQKLSDFCYQW